jgi:teichuronic acid biosynthesis glycosyltransferase TuaC
MSLPGPTPPIPSPEQAPRLSVLTLTSLYPNAYSPGWALFNQRQIRALAGLCRLGLVAPLPFTQAWPGLLNPAALASESFPLRRPWFFYLPWFKRAWHGRAFLASAWPSLRGLAREIAPQVLYATWLFPDAWAGLIASRRLGIPLALKLHGSDLALANDPARGAYARQALARASAVIAPSRELLARAGELGVDPARLFLVPNGVERDIFRPCAQAEARQELGLPSGPLVLFLGRLEPVKGADLALTALTRLPGVSLVVAGEGSLAMTLRAQAKALGLGPRVIWVGGQTPARVARHLAACDALFLPSLSEGEPNAVLEALASGRPVAAAMVGAVPELVREGVTGALARPGDPIDLAVALGRVLRRKWDPDALSAAVAGRSWGASANALLQALTAAARAGGAA